MPDEYDSPWKEALEVYLQRIMNFCFPEQSARISWESGFEFLDKELQEVTRDAALGEQRVDKLVKVRLLDGSEEWILVHIEVQSQPDQELPRRVYQYHHRVRDRFGSRVASFVILADNNVGWRPGRYQEELLGTRLTFQFVTCKLMDSLHEAREAARAGEPSAVIVLANWAAQTTRGDMTERLRLKWDLTRQLYEAGFTRKDILELYRLLDWLMRLPKALEAEYKQQLQSYEAAKVMPYITSIELLGREDGRLEALRENIIDVLESRFEAIPSFVADRLGAIRDVALLKQRLREAAISPSLSDFLAKV